MLFQTLLRQTGVAAISGSVPSLAAILAASEPEALSLSFMDSTFLTRTGFYGSAWVKDAGTPANDYDNSLDTSLASLFTYTSPSPKNILHADGEYKYAAHNLYLNSSSPANQSITVKSGFTYAVTIEGSVSVTASGAATGTWTAGTNTFTSATTTLTLGSTSGTGHVQVYETPAAYVKLVTGGSPRYALPLEFDTNGDPIGLRPESAKTNVFLNSDTGVTQDCSVSATAYTLSFWGTGTITLSGASSAGPLVGSGVNNRVTLTFTPSAGTLTLTVSGTCSRVQLEAGSSASSYIRTFGSTVTRAADNIRLATTAFPYNATDFMWYVKIYMSNTPINGRAIGTASATAPIFMNTTPIYVGSWNGSQQLLYTRPSTYVGKATKNAMTVGTGVRRLVSDGGTPVSDTYGQGTITHLVLGSNQGVSDFAEGYIQEVLAVPREYSAAQIQALTEV